MLMEQCFGSNFIFRWEISKLQCISSLIFVSILCNYRSTKLITTHTNNDSGLLQNVQVRNVKEEKRYLGKPCRWKLNIISSFGNSQEKYPTGALQ